MKEKTLTKQIRREKEIKSNHLMLKELRYIDKRISRLEKLIPKILESEDDICFKVKPFEDLKRDKATSVFDIGKFLWTNHYKGFESEESGLSDRNKDDASCLEDSSRIKLKDNIPPIVLLEMLGVYMHHLQKRQKVLRGKLEI